MNITATQKNARHTAVLLLEYLYAGIITATNKAICEMVLHNPVTLPAQLMLTPSLAKSPKIKVIIAAIAAITSPQNAQNFVTSVVDVELVFFFFAILVSPLIIIIYDNIIATFTAIIKRTEKIFLFFRKLF